MPSSPRPRRIPNPHARRSQPAAPALMLLIAVLCPALAWGGVEVILSPPGTTVEPGEEFTVELMIPTAMSAFNGYDAMIGYDPDLLRLLPESSPSVREGELMVDACPSLRWNQFSVSQDSMQISIAHVLLCAGVRVTGPGVLYRLRFEAKEQTGVTSIAFLEGTRFYDAGEYVEPVVTDDALVTIGQGTSAPPLRAPIAMRAVPNPFNPSTVFTFTSTRAGSAHLRIIGVDGRLVRRMELGWLDAGTHRVPWDGTDQDGRRLASGRYLAHLHHSAGEAVCGAVLLK